MTGSSIRKASRASGGIPLFKGLFGGEYVWDPNVDQLLPFVGYFGGDSPKNGEVIAVDKSYVFIYARPQAGDRAQAGPREDRFDRWGGLFCEGKQSAAQSRSAHRERTPLSCG